MVTSLGCVVEPEHLFNLIVLDLTTFVPKLFRIAKPPDRICFIMRSRAGRRDFPPEAWSSNTSVSHHPRSSQYFFTSANWESVVWLWLLKHLLSPLT